MKCPACGERSIVKDSRLTPGKARRRRRICLNGHLFTTYEAYERPLTWRDISRIRANLMSSLDLINTIGGGQDSR